MLEMTRLAFTVSITKRSTTALAREVSGWRVKKRELGDDALLTEYEVYIQTWLTDSKESLQSDKPVRVQPASTLSSQAWIENTCWFSSYTNLRWSFSGTGTVSAIFRALTFAAEVKIISAMNQCLEGIRSRNFGAASCAGIVFIGLDRSRGSDPNDWIVIAQSSKAETTFLAHNVTPVFGCFPNETAKLRPSVTNLQGWDDSAAVANLYAGTQIWSIGPTVGTDAVFDMFDQLELPEQQEPAVRTAVATPRTPSAWGFGKPKGSFGPRR